MLRRFTAPSSSTSCFVGAAASSSSCSSALRFHGSNVGGPKIRCTEKAKLTRDAKYKTVTATDVDFFKSIFAADAARAVVDSKPALDEFNSDWFKDYEGQGPVCLLPKTTEQVAEIMKYCSREKIAVTPQGGNTGFVGGSVPVFDEVILSLKRMNKMLELDEMSGTLKCQAGCILENLDNEVQSKGFLMPIDLGAKGSCHIGGNVSTNAGGLRYFRYGSMHANTLGLTVVLPSGEVLDLMNVLKKDNTGYDLKHLFIGSEGTLGIVTEVALQLATKPLAVNTMFLGARDWDSFCKLYVAARRELGEILSAAEMIDGQALRLILDITKGQSPLGDAPDCQFYLLLETNGSNQEHDQAKLFAFLEKACDGSGSSDQQPLATAGTVAESSNQAKHIWSMRELCATAPTQVGHVRWYDVSMPSTGMAEMIAGCRDAVKTAGLEDKAKIIGFGHFSDGNLHINVCTIPSYDQQVVDVVDGFVYGFAKQRRYSVSAEHGIGIQKKKYLPYSRPVATIEHMKNIKKLFDRDNILNPYKVFQ